MTCNHIRYQLPDFVHNMLSERENKIVLDHLATCKTCSHETEELRLLLSRMDKEKAPAPSETYFTSLLPEIHKLIEREKTKVSPAWMTRFAMPVAAVFVLVLFLARVNPIRNHHSHEELRVLLEQLDSNDVLQVVEQYTSTWTQSTISVVIDDTLSYHLEDYTLLAELLNEESNGNIYDNINLQSIIESMDDKEFENMLSLLGKQSYAD